MKIRSSIIKTLIASGRSSELLELKVRVVAHLSK